MNLQFARWYILYVKFRHEQKIHSLLEQAGFDSFLPLISVTKNWSDRKKRITTPLFPCYVFIKLSSKSEFYKVLSIKGVFNFVSFGGNYSALSEEEINKIKDFLLLKKVSNVKVVKKYIPMVGEKKEINQGILKGMPCEVIKTKNNNKIIVHIESLNQTIVASIPVSYLVNSKGGNVA